LLCFFQKIQLFFKNPLRRGLLVTLRHGVRYGL
jgi:hypothetical protein